MPTETPTTNTPTTPPVSAVPPHSDSAPVPMTSTIMNAPLYKPKNKLIPITIILAILALAGLITSVLTLIKSSDQESELITLKNELDRYQAIYEAENPKD